MEPGREPQGLTHTVEPLINGDFVKIFIPLLGDLLKGAPFIGDIAYSEVSNLSFGNGVEVTVVVTKSEGPIHGALHDHLDGAPHCSVRRVVGLLNVPKPLTVWVAVVFR